MKKIVYFILVASLALSSLFALDSCSTSKHSTTRNGELGVPNYKQIKKKIGSKGNEFYYPELLRRFETADTSMTVEQYYYFYYGTATRPDYNPYQGSNYDELREALRGDTLTKDNWRRAAQAIEKQLKSDPTNLRFHVYKQIAYSNLYGEDSMEANNSYMQAIMLYFAIRATGDGQSPETAFHVICTTDEYGLMEMLGLSPKSQSLIEKNGRSYDVMELEENEIGLESMYFDVTVGMEALNKMFGY